MRLDYRQLYSEEFESRDRLRAAIGMPVGLLTVFASLLATMLRDPPPAPGFLAWLFATGAASGTYFFVRAAYYLVRSFHGHTYKVAPTPLELEAFWKDLRQWHKTYGKGKDGARVDFAKYLRDTYVTDTDHNALVNAEKAEYLFRAHGAMIYTGMLAGLALIPFSIFQFFKHWPQ